MGGGDAAATPTPPGPVAVPVGSLFLTVASAGNGEYQAGAAPISTTFTPAIFHRIYQNSVSQISFNI